MKQILEFKTKIKVHRYKNPRGEQYERGLIVIKRDIWEAIKDSVKDKKVLVKIFVEND